MLQHAAFSVAVYQYSNIGTVPHIVLVRTAASLQFARWLLYSSSLLDLGTGIMLFAVPVLAPPPIEHPPLVLDTACCTGTCAGVLVIPRYRYQS